MEVIIVQAKDFCKYVTDGTHDSPKQQKEGYYLITSKHLMRDKLDFSNAKKISYLDYEKVIKRSKVEQWDILFSMIGTIGNVYIETNKNVKYACKNVGIFKMDGNEQNSKWLYYYLQSPNAKEYIHGSLRGTTQEYIPLDALRKMPIPNFNETTKKNIIKILWKIDEKIKLNNEINNNLVA